jgi:hypothetical protein
MRQTFGDGGSIIQDSNTTGAVASSHNDIHHKGRDWLPVQGLARPARCKYAMFGSPDRKLGQARVVQKAPSSQARPMRVPLAFSPGLAHVVQGAWAWGAQCVHVR